MIARLARSPWAALVLALAWLAATGWMRPLALPDEGRYVGVAWHMLTSGDWLTPQLNGLPYFHKPPLFYWITASSLWAFGAHEWAARIAPWLGATIGTTALFAFARHWWGERVARLALLALVTQPLVFVGAQFANLDMLVAGIVAASILGFAHASMLLPTGRGTWRWALAAAYVLAALAVLAKGLIGAVLPALVIGTWLVMRREWRQIPRLLWPPGLALFVLVVAPWFVLMQLRFPDFAHYFFVIQHFARYAQSGFNNAQPFWFFPAVLGLLALPWSAWLLARAPRNEAPEPETNAGALRQLLWIWLAVVTLFFSLPQSKLIGYILPATWPLALLVADRFGRSQQASPRAGGWWRASAVGAVAICVGVVVVVALIPQKSSRDLGLAMRGKVERTDRVVFLHEYDFDLPFYAGLQRPSIVVEDWNGAAAQGDNWRKEIADAGQFDKGQARAVIVMPDAWQSSLCDAGAVWVIGGRSAVERYPVLRLAQEVMAQRDRVLWRFPAGSAAVLKAAGCAPSANAGGKVAAR